MSLAAPYQEHYYVADGVTTSFSFGEYFTGLSQAYVKCIVYFDDGTNCVPTFTVDMTTGFITIVTLTKPDGTVLTVPPAGSIVRVFRDTPEAQNVTASQLQNYTAKQLERIFDSVVAMIQEVSYSDLHKTIRLTETQRDIAIDYLPNDKDQAVIYWDVESRKLMPADFGQNQVVKSDGIEWLVYNQSEGKVYFIPREGGNPIPIGKATIHNDLSGRNAPDCHPESAITNLTTHLQELRDKDTEIEAKADYAVSTADEAKDLATTAKNTADAAYEKAEETERVVQGFDDRITQAEQDASDAKNTVNTHIADKNNPHEVTKAQVGLGNVDNTADLDKPVIIKSATIPTASADLVGKEYQYFGTTNETYTHGFVYECSVITTPSSITASQTTGTSLSDIAVDIDTFEAYVEPTTDTTLVFTYDNAQSEWIDAEENIVQLSDYGISYTGTPENDDVITVAYTAEAISYDWVRVNLQPVIDNLTSTSTTAALSANQGKVLNDRIDDVSGRGRYLSLWNCATGLAETNPPESPYTYKAGDYFVVGTVSSATPAVNYKPDGSSYTTGTPSTTVETNEVSVNDTYFYDGTVWKLQSNAQKKVALSGLADVDLGTLEDGQALIYDADTGKWTNGNGGVSATYDATTKTITFA